MSNPQRWNCVAVSHIVYPETHEECSELYGERSGICLKYCLHSIPWNRLREAKKTCDIVEGLEWFYGDQNYATMSEWLQSPNNHLNGWLPIDLINTGIDTEIDRVMYALNKLLEEDLLVHMKGT